MWTWQHVWRCDTESQSQNTFCIHILQKIEFCIEGSFCMRGLYCIWVKVLFFSYEYYDILFWCFSSLCIVKTYFKTCTFQYSWNILRKNLTIALYMLTPFHSHYYTPTCSSPQETILREYRYTLWAGLTKYLSRCVYISD